VKSDMTPLEPAAKRQRVEAVVTTTVEAPPLPSSQATGVSALPVAAEDPFAAAAAVEAGTSFDAAATENAPKVLLPEAEFAASLEKPDITLQVRVPNDRTQMAYNFYGQIVSVTMDVMSTIKSIKQELAKSHLNSMPANKIQLKSTSTGVFLKDSSTLATLNIGPMAMLELVPRARGGRK